MSTVNIYSTGCPKCNILIKKLKENGIDFNEYNQVDKLIDMGFKTAPILEVDGEMMEFGQAIRWVNNYNK